MAKMTFDLQKLLRAAQNLPQALAGAVLPPQIAQYAPYIDYVAAGSKLLSGMIDDSSGLSGDGMPETGPLGKGRREYERKGSQWSDAEVSAATLAILDENNVPPSVRPTIKTLRGIVSYTLGVLCKKSIEASTEAELRKSVDFLVSESDVGIDSDLQDSFGDLLNFTLRLNRSATAIRAKQEE